MSSIELFHKHLKLKGKSLEEINPGSDEYALSVEDAIEGIELLKATNTAVLGGDIMTTDSERLVYAYQAWGTEYHYLSWYCEKALGESHEDYAKRSIKEALNAIKNAENTAVKMESSCYVVVVI